MRDDSEFEYADGRRPLSLRDIQRLRSATQHRQFTCDRCKRAVRGQAHTQMRATGMQLLCQTCAAH